jgi:hypothetical protein
LEHVYQDKAFISHFFCFLVLKFDRKENVWVTVDVEITAAHAA